MSTSPGKAAADSDFERLFRLARDLMCVVDRENRFVRVNPAFSRLLGFDETDLLGADCLDFLHPDDRHFAEEAGQALTAGQDVFEMEARFRTKDGRYRWIAWSAAFALEPNLGYAVGRDVTERREAETMLAQREQELRQLFELLDEGVTIRDPQGRALAFNPSAARLLEGGSGNGVRPIDPGEGPVFTDERGRRLEVDDYPLHRVLRTGQPIRGGLFGCTRPDGSVVWLRGSSIPLRREGEEKPYAVLNSFTDVTRIREHNLELERLSYVARETSSLVTVTDSERRVEWVNPTFERTTGYGLEEVRGRTVSDLLPGPETDREALESLHASLAEGKAFRTEILLYTKSKQPFWLAVAVNPILDDGECKGYVAVGTDVTDSKRLSLELEESERLHRLVLNNVREVIFRCDSAGRWTFLNQAWQDITGYAVEDSIGRDCTEAVLAEDRAALRRALRQLTLGRRDTIRQQVRCRTVAGGVCWLEVFARAVRTESGEIRDVFGTLNDVSQTLHTVQELRRERDFSEAILVSASSLIIVADAQGRIVRFNRGCEQTTGYLAEEVAGRYFWEVFHSEDEWEELREGYRRLVRSGLEGPSENYWMAKDGRPRLIAWSNTLLRAPDGTIEHVVGVGRDVTNERGVEAALREAQYQLELAVRGSTDGIWDWDIQTGRRYFSSRWKSMLGYDDSLPNTEATFYSLLHPDDRLRFREHLRRYLDGQILAFEIEFRMRHRDGSWRWILSRATAVRDEQGRALRMAGSHTDITDRTQAEEELRRSEAMLADTQAIASVGSWTWEVANNRLRWSTQTFAIYGVDPSEGEPSLERLMELLHPDDLPRFRLVTNRIESPHAYEQTFRIVRPDGATRYLTVKGTPSFEDGRLVAYLGSVQDVTDRMLVESTLRETEERFRLLAENIQSIFWIWDAGLRGFSYVSPAYRVLLHGDVDRLYRHPLRFLRMVHAEDRPRLREFLRSVQQERSRLLCRVTLPEGGVRWIRVLGYPLRGADGDVARVLGVVDDVTESVESRQALEQSERLLAEAQRLAKLGSWEMDAASGRLVWSPQTFTLFDRDPLLGNPTGAEYLNEIIPNEREKVARMYREALQGQTLDYEIERIARNGEKRWLRVIGEPIRTSNGSVTRLRGSVQDVTEQKLAELKLLAQRQFLRSVIDTDPNLIFVKNYEGRFVLANRAVAEVYGTTPEDIIGKTDADFNPNPDEIDHFRHDDRYVIDSRTEMRNFEERLTSVTGLRWLQTVKRPLYDPETDEWRLFGISTDITHRKEIERQLVEAREQALEASRLKSEFLANMSHEIRTPMNGVLGMTDLLFETPLSSEQKEFVGTLRASAEGLLTILNDVLDFSKIEAGRMELEINPVDLLQLAEEICSLFARDAEAKGLDLMLEVPAGEILWYEGDVVRLRQVLSNLVGNALKFTEAGHVAIQIEPYAYGVKLSVRDTGIGIPPERQNAVFESFVQADGSTTRRFGGTGLGLSIVRQLVHLMNGSISLTSTVGVGSRFVVDLPLTKWDGGPTRAIAHTGLDAWLIGTPDEIPTVVGVLRSLGCAIWAEPSPPPEVDLVVIVGERDALPEVPGFSPTYVQVLGGDADALPGAFVLRRPLTHVAVKQAILGWLTGSTNDHVPAGTTAVQRRERVLLVEDNPVNRMVANLQLKRLGFSPDVAVDGQQAVALAAENDYDLILMDVQMPLLDGCEATVMIREHEARTGRRAHIVAMTAHALKADFDRCLASGMDGYLSKPVRFEELKARLEEVLDLSSVVKLDLDILADTSGGDPLFEHELLEVYENSAAQQIQDLIAAMRRDDAESGLRAVHTVKGSSRAIGAVDFADQCQMFEARLRARRASLDDALALEKAFANVRAACADRRATLAKNF